MAKGTYKSGPCKGKHRCKHGHPKNSCRCKRERKGYHQGKGWSYYKF